MLVALQRDKTANLKAKKSSMLLEIRLKQSSEIQDKIDDAKLDTMDYDSKWGRYRIRVDKMILRKTENFLEI